MTPDKQLIEALVDDYLEYKRAEYLQENEPTVVDQLKKGGEEFWKTAGKHKLMTGLGALGLAGAGMGVKHLLGSGKRKRLGQEKDWWKAHAQAAQHQHQLAQTHIAGLQHHIAGMRGQDQPAPRFPPPAPMYGSSGYQGAPMAQQSIYHPQHSGAMHYPRPHYGY